MKAATMDRRRTGKDFPRRGGVGKKYPRTIGVGLVVLLIGGLGMARAQERAPAASTAEEMRATLTFVEEAIITGETIRLRDIARVEARDPALKAALEALEIGRAPGIGQALSIRADSVRLIVRRERKHLGISDNVISLNGAMMTRVRTESQTIEPTALLERIQPWVVDQAKTAYGAERVEITYATSPRPIEVPLGDWEATPLLTRLPRRTPSILTMPVSVSVGGSIVTTVNMALKLRLYAMVPVAARAIPRQEELAESDVKYVELDLTALNGRNPVPRFEEVFGLRARRDIRAGEPLTDENSESLPLVTKGDQVTVYLEAPRLRLTTIGLAQESGRYGDVIRVKNLRSGQIVRGVVVRERLIRIDFPTLRVGRLRGASATALAR